MTARRPPLAVHVARHTVAARHGRVWLHQEGDGDGDLTPAEARAVAAALLAAAGRAERQHQRLDEATAAMTAEAERGTAAVMAGVTTTEEEALAWLRPRIAETTGASEYGFPRSPREAQSDGST